MAPSEGIEPPVQEPESYVLSITPRGQLNTKKSTHSRLYEKHDVDNPHFLKHTRKIVYRTLIYDLNYYTNVLPTIQL